MKKMFGFLMVITIFTIGYAQKRILPPVDEEPAASCTNNPSHNDGVCKTATKNGNATHYCVDKDCVWDTKDCVK